MLKFFYRGYKKASYYLKRRQLPWRLKLLKYFLPAFLHNPQQSLKLLGKISKGQLDFYNLYLIIFGPTVLKDIFDACQKVNIQPFLLWGTLLGCIREGRFIQHDNDVDLGLLKDDYLKKDLFIEDMCKKGYCVSQDNNFLLAFYHSKRESPALCIHSVYEKKGQIAISDQVKERTQVQTHYFSASIFKRFIKVKFEGMDVLIPAQAEKFVEAAYGADWRIPKSEWDHLGDCLNPTFDKVIEVSK